MTLSADWLSSHWTTVVTAVATFAYFYVNVIPRPDHAEMVGLRGVWWRTMDLICFLTSDRLFGKPKMPGTYSPPLVPPAKPVLPVDLPQEVVVREADEAHTAAEENGTK